MSDASEFETLTAQKVFIINKSPVQKLHESVREAMLEDIANRFFFLSIA